MDHPSGKIVCVVGARPNYMKMAPLVRALTALPAAPSPLLVHTGQHYDLAMNEKLFTDLQMPAPDVNLEVGSASHAVQTAEVMRRFEEVVDKVKTACVVVVGDVNSTLACALVAAKKGIPVAHVEAGLRSFDRSMPEEVNRVLTDQISDLLYTTERKAEQNLLREGIDAGKIEFVGNLMIDSLRSHLPRAVPPHATLEGAGLQMPARYAVVTLHRPSNVDNPDTLDRLLDVLAGIARKLPIVWPIHPRTRANIERFGLSRHLGDPGLLMLSPQGYLEMLGLMSGATLVLTDSGGIQEETTALGIPCLTLRENTERPITIEQGTNTLVGRDPAAIAAATEEILARGGKRGRIPELWDGRSAERLTQHLVGWLRARPAAA